MTTLEDQLRRATPRSYPTLDHAALQHRGRRRRRVTRASMVVGAVVALGGVVGAGSMLAGSRQPPEPMAAVVDVEAHDEPACEVVGGVYATPEACAESIRSDVLAQVEADGSTFERRVLADAEVSSAEYEEAAHRATACMNRILGEALSGATVRAVRHETSLGSEYGFEYVVPDDEEAVAPEQVDWAEEQVDTPSCRQEHFDNVHHVWVAGMIAAHGG